MKYDDQRDELVFQFEREARECAGFINALMWETTPGFSILKSIVKVEFSCYDEWVVSKIKMELPK
jgi:hypothetical protein